jgi:hypothetical protein
MHDVPRASRSRHTRDHEAELGRSGLLGSAVAMDTRASSRDPRRPARPAPPARPSDALIAECTCPVECIRDHEHE